MALLGIDVGSGGCKCGTFAAAGALIALRQREHNRPPGATEYDGLAIWETVKELGAAVVRETPEPVTAVAVASIGEAVAPVAADGTPLHAFMQSTFPTRKEYLDRIRKLVGDRIRQVTGLTPLARYSLCKLMYLREERPEQFRRAWKFMMLEDYIAYRLCGRAVSDYSAASRSAAFNLDEKRYDETILAAVGLDPSRFCELHPPGAAAGETTPAAAADLGLCPGTPVVLAGHDTIPENLGSGLLAAGAANVGCGSFEGVGVLIPARPGPNPALLANNLSREPYPLAGCEFINGINPNAGNLLKWFRDEFAAAECAEAAASGTSPFRILDEAMPASPTGIIVVPHFSGAGAPEFEPRARGTITGLTLSSRRNHLYKAFLEAIAFEMAHIVNIYRKCGIAVAEISAASGGARSRPWLQIRSDILGLPVTPLAGGETTLSGSAMLAGVATGVYPDLETAARLFVKKGTPVEPNPHNHAIYREHYERYMKARALLLGFWT